MKSTLISLAVIVTIIILLYLSPIGYIIPGVFKIYGTGHTTAFLDDYKIFDNLIVENGSIKTKWSHHNLYNQMQLSKEFDLIIKKEKLEQEKKSISKSLLKSHVVSPIPS